MSLLRREKPDPDKDAKEGLLATAARESEDEREELDGNEEGVEMSATASMHPSAAAASTAAADDAAADADDAGGAGTTRHEADAANTVSAATAAADAADDAAGATESEIDEAELDAQKAHWSDCFVEDVRVASKEAFNPFTLLTCVIAGFSIFYALVGNPLDYHMKQRKPNLEGGFHDREEFAKKERRIPAEHEQLAMKRALLYSHSVVGVSADEEGTNVTLGMFARSDFEDVAQARLPEVWYRCMHVGVSALDFFDPDLASLSVSDWDDDEFYSTLHESPDDREWHEERGEAWKARKLEVDQNSVEMLEQLWDLRPARPSAVLNWDIASNVTSWPWRVQGWVVRFCPEDLAAQGELGSGPTPKSRFEHAAEGVAVVARRFGQNIVLHWYPHQWGKGALHDEHLHTNVLQEIVPTRSGMQAVRSHGVVWRIGGPVPKPAVVQLTPEELEDIMAMAAAAGGDGA